MIKLLISRITKIRSARISLKEQAHFAARLAFLIGAGMPLLEALVMLRNQMRSKRRQMLFGHVVTEISNGQRLSQALTAYGGWSLSTLQMMRIGEMSGSLQMHLEYISEELKKKLVLSQKIKAALVYPLFITIATLSVTIVLSVYIFPKILPILKSVRGTLPLTTRILIFLSDFSKHYGVYLLLAAALCGGAAIFMCQKYARVKSLIEEAVIHMPLVGNIYQAYELASWCRTLGVLLRSGLSLTESITELEASTQALGYKMTTGRLLEAVKTGTTISESLQQYPRFFPDLATHLIAVGEVTGNLSATLLYLSDYFEHELDNYAKNLSAAIEPLLMIFMGGVVGFIAISVITPIYRITEHLNG